MSLLSKKEWFIVIAAFALVVCTYYAGNKVGYSKGAIKGYEAGQVMAWNSMMADKIATGTERLPLVSANVGKSLCLGFAKDMPCKTVDEAKAMVLSDDTLDQLIGTSCMRIQLKLESCEILANKQ